ncbi:MAG TPA: hypothetical protein VIT88_10335 [Pyrinomonadaceae bacterium]
MPFINYLGAPYLKLFTCASVRVPRNPAFDQYFNLPIEQGDLMPPPYDTVVSIGGQSLLDGVWRMLQPALQSLNTARPVSLPGMNNSWVRIRNITPSLSTSPPGLRLTIYVEVLGDILVTGSVKGDTLNLALPKGNFSFPKSALGELNLPAQSLNITDLRLTGTPAITTATGNISVAPNAPANRLLPITDGTLDLSDLKGDFAFVAGTLGSVGLPLPALVPLAINLTRTSPAQIDVTLSLSVDPVIGPSTASGIRLNLGPPIAGAVSTLRATTIANDITTALTQLLTQLGVTLPTPQLNPLFEPFENVGPRRAEITTIASAIATAAQTAILTVVTDAFSGLAVQTGRLIFPPAGAGASCDVNVLPTSGDMQLVVAPNGTPVLQVGFGRTSSTDIPSLPTSAPIGSGDTFLTVGNVFLLELLCCLVERMPGFTFPVARSLPVRNTNLDVRGFLHTLCSNFNGVTINIGPLSLMGGISVCIDGASGTRKTISLVGNFAQVGGFTLANVNVAFTLPLTFDLDNLASVANLRAVGTPTVTANVSPNPALVAIIAVGGILLIGPAVAVVANALLLGACEMASRLLNNAVRTVLGVASLLRSPAALPLGLFEAFGKFVPMTVLIDDLTADCVLETPTTPWSVPARVGLRSGKPVVADLPGEPFAPVPV